MSAVAPVSSLAPARLSLKPLPYYVGVHALGRAVLARRRLRGAPPRWHGVRIFGYHRVVDEPRDVLAVSPSVFGRQMELLVQSGVEPVGSERALDILERGTPGRFAWVTFDDAYHDNLEHAVPVLTRLGIPATIFAPSAMVDGSLPYYWYSASPRAATWPELREVVAGGVVDVQPHTRTHPRLPALSEANAREEIVGSRRDVAVELGTAPTVFSYPAGLFGEREARLVREAGYRAAVTTDPGVNGPTGPDLERLARTMIAWRDGEDEFAAKLAGLFDEPLRLRTVVHRLRSRARG